MSTKTTSFVEFGLIFTLMAAMAHSAEMIEILRKRKLCNVLNVLKILLPKTRVGEQG